MIARHNKLYDIDLAYGCSDGTYLYAIRMGGISDSLEHQDLRLCQKALSFRRKFYFALFLLKIYNLIQNLYTLRYYLTFNFAAHSSSG